MADWPKGMSGKSRKALEDAGLDPDTASRLSVEQLVALGCAETFAKLVVQERVPEYIETIRVVTGRYPNKAIWDALEQQTAGLTKEQLTSAWSEHLMNGGNPMNYIKWFSIARRIASQPTNVLPVPSFLRPATAAQIKPTPNMSAVDMKAREIENGGVAPHIAYRMALNLVGNG